MEVKDLCGGRIITYSTSVLDTACNVVKRFFKVDLESSDHIESSGDRRKLEANQFGYCSVHYVVLFDARAVAKKLPGLLKDEDIEKLATLPNPCAEIQIRTILSHAWAVVSHGLAYKASFEFPKEWEHENASVSASLEQADQAFNRIQRGMQEYANSYGAYLEDTKARDLLRMYYDLHKREPKNVHTAIQAGKLANGYGQHELAIEVLKDIHQQDNPTILVELGTAKIRHNWREPYADEYKHGQELLIRACELSPKNTQALLVLAETYDIDGQNKDSLRGKYLQRAYEADAEDPAVLCEYLLWHMTNPSNASSISTYIQLMKPAILGGIKRCEDQKAVKRNVPIVYSRLAFLRLLDIFDTNVDSADNQVQKTQRENELYENLRCVTQSGDLSAIRSVVRTSMRLATVGKLLGSTRFSALAGFFQAIYGFDNESRSEAREELRTIIETYLKSGIVDENSKGVYQQFLNLSDRAQDGRVVVSTIDIDREAIREKLPEFGEAPIISLPTLDVVPPKPDDAGGSDISDLTIPNVALLAGLLIAGVDMEKILVIDDENSKKSTVSVSDKPEGNIAQLLLKGLGVLIEHW